jgi:hypothetical protein
MGHRTDDELANAVYLYDHRSGLESIGLLTAAKERIRWLSRRLVEAGSWQDISTAPKDRSILILVVHVNAKYSKDPVAEGWIAIHEAHWLEHNAGGFTWNGLCGTPMLWHSLPVLPDVTKLVSA